MFEDFRMILDDFLESDNLKPFHWDVFFYMSSDGRHGQQNLILLSERYRCVR